MTYREIQLKIIIIQNQIDVLDKKPVANFYKIKKL